MSRLSVRASRFRVRVVLLSAVLAALVLWPSLSEASDPTDPVFNSGNGHYYQLTCGAGLTWQEAVDASALLSWEGLPGHLATVTDQAEHDFLTATFATIGTTDVWLGASDLASEGTWLWITGESWGDPNWGDTNWCPGEPNSDSQDCLTYQTNASDCWDDLGCEVDDEAACYIVEFEAAVPALPNAALALLLVSLLGVSLQVLRKRTLTSA